MRAFMLSRKFITFFLVVLSAALLFTAIANTTRTQTLEAKSGTESQKDNIYLGLIIKDNDNFIPSFLKSIDHLDFDKKKMIVEVSNFNTSPETVQLVQQWASENQDKYKAITFVDNKISVKLTGRDSEKFKLLGHAKNDFLTRTQENQCHHCLIVESDTLLAPFALKELLSKNKPVIAPLLRPIPEANDPFRNFYSDATEQGYYKEHPDYWPIADRYNIGTFKVPCIQTVYLIQSDYANKLNFIDGGNEWEFIVFSRSANKNNVEQYICNEREFGSFLHFRKDLTEEEERKFVLAKSDKEVTPPVLNSLMAPYCADDPLLQQHVDNFDYDKYAIYRVANRDCFYADENYDLIKSQFIKKGSPWEENIHEEFKKYVKPDTVALDIGGHMGTHTLNLSRLVGDNGTVHVFEPRVKMFTELVTNMSLNDCKNVVFHRRALGNEEKEVKMFIPRPDNEGMARIIDGKGEESETAKMERLDSLELNNVSLIKIDVEGFEMEVIKGGIKTILRNKPVMLVEIFQGPENLNRIKTIEDLGYSHFHLFGDDYLFLPTEKAA
jgi:FkbM family methyltransferase